jgi:hypothetical protein
MFKANYMDSNCLRCGKTVYPTDKIGPLKDYSFFHSGCFRCVECSSKLTLKERTGSTFNSTYELNCTLLDCWLITDHMVVIISTMYSLMQIRIRDLFNPGSGMEKQDPG